MVQCKKIAEVEVDFFMCDFCKQEVMDGYQHSQPGPRHEALWQCKLCDKDVCLSCQRTMTIKHAAWGLLCPECSETHHFEDGEIVEKDNS